MEERKPEPRTMFHPRFHLLVFLLSVLLSDGIGQADGHSHEWSYDNNKDTGPLHWKEHFGTCGGSSQSPVDLKGAVESDSLSPLALHGYDAVLKNAVLVNNGHTVRLSSKLLGAWLSGGCLGDERYYFEQLHFHWGADDKRGSEHTLNGKSFPLEGHFVHRNGKYHDVAEASEHADGLAVLGVFYKVSGTGLARVKTLFSALRSVAQGVHDKDVKVGPTLTLRDLLPEDLSSFYCYLNGSLTTPTCNQAVTWTLLDDTAPIGTDQLELFRKLHYNDGKPMVDNFRPVQPLNGRTIQFYRSSAASSPAGHHLFLLLSFSGFLVWLSRRQTSCAPCWTGSQR